MTVWVWASPQLCGTSFARPLAATSPERPESFLNPWEKYEKGRGPQVKDDYFQYIMGVRSWMPLLGLIISSGLWSEVWFLSCTKKLLPTFNAIMYDALRSKFMHGNLSVSSSEAWGYYVLQTCARKIASHHWKDAFEKNDHFDLLCLNFSRGRTSTVCCQHTRSWRSYRVLPWSAFETLDLHWPLERTA